jgi:hypothetical protein
VSADPDPEHISTSHVERQNLTMRMSMRRFTRLTNAFSKKVENLAAAISIHFLHYNFARVHKTLGTTPAMAAGVADHPWDLAEIIALLEAAEARKPRKRGPYKKARAGRPVRFKLTHHPGSLWGQAPVVRRLGSSRSASSSAASSRPPARS